MREHQTVLANDCVNLVSCCLAARKRISKPSSPRRDKKKVCKNKGVFSDRQGGRENHRGKQIVTHFTAQGREFLGLRLTTGP